MSDQTDDPERLARIRAALELGQQDSAWLDAHPEILEPYRGEWVLVHQQRIVAHAPDGREFVKHANARTHPGSTLLYVPTREEAAAVHVL